MALRRQWGRCLEADGGPSCPLDGRARRCCCRLRPSPRGLRALERSGCAPTPPPLLLLLRPDQPVSIGSRLSRPYLHAHPIRAPPVGIPVAAAEERSIVPTRQGQDQDRHAWHQHWGTGCLRGHNWLLQRIAGLDWLDSPALPCQLPSSLEGPTQGKRYLLLQLDQERHKAATTVVRREYRPLQSLPPPPHAQARGWWVQERHKAATTVVQGPPQQHLDPDGPHRGLLRDPSLPRPQRCC